jgi:hypothetical protein
MKKVYIFFGLILIASLTSTSQTLDQCQAKFVGEMDTFITQAQAGDISSSDKGTYIAIALSIKYCSCYCDASQIDALYQQLKYSATNLRNLNAQLPEIPNNSNYASRCPPKSNDEIVDSIINSLPSNVDDGLPKSFSGVHPEQTNTNDSFVNSQPQMTTTGIATGSSTAIDGNGTYTGGTSANYGQINQQQLQNLNQQLIGQTRETEESMRNYKNSASKIKAKEIMKNNNKSVTRVNLDESEDDTYVKNQADEEKVMKKDFLEKRISKYRPSRDCSNPGTEIKVQGILFTNEKSINSYEHIMPWSQWVSIPGTAIELRYSKKRFCKEPEFPNTTDRDENLQYIDEVSNQFFDYGFVQLRNMSSSTISGHFQLRNRTDNGFYLENLPLYLEPNELEDESLGNWYIGCEIISIKVMDYCTKY